MKKRKFDWQLWLMICVFVAGFIIIIVGSPSPVPSTDEETAKCIGEKTTIYVQLGCSACETQEELFGDNYQYLNVIDCVFEPSECVGVQYTPTWKINGELSVGVKSIEELKELTGC